MRIRRLLVNLFLVAAASIIAFGLCEVIVRLAAPQQLIQIRPDLFLPLDTLGYGHQPNIDLTVNTGERDVRVRTDAAGFRIARAGRAVGQHKLLLLGDSFVEALQVEYEQSVSGLIERCFPIQTGQTAAVWNSAVSGWDPPQYLMQLRRTLRSGRFDLVLVSVYLGNDVVAHRRDVVPPRQPERRRHFRFPSSLRWAEVTDAVLAPVNDGLETRSHLFILLKLRFQSLLIRAGLTAVKVPSEIQRNEASSPRWALTAGILAEIDSLAANAGVPTIFALLPSVEQVDPDILRFRAKWFGINPASLDLDQPDRLLGAELQRRGLSYTSLLEPLRSAQRSGLQLYGRVDSHFTSEGHRIYWETIAPVIAQRLGVPFRPATSTDSCAVVPTSPLRQQDSSDRR